ncbi:MAG TPA: hypothetical protein VEW42_03310 [Candidatus Eisenbacteria bacterium]|nr:hypothetical protein [Candidatus Eisenbacteria bacterium]
MDDNTQVQQPTDQAVADPAVSSMNDVAGMTPPPAPVMPDPVANVADAAPTADAMASMSAPDPVAPAPSMDMPASNAANPAGEKAADDDYSYAEDVLNEILDSLDRIEAKLEAIEKKG